LTQDRALRNLLAWTGLRPGEAVAALTANPAKALSLTERGRIEPGAIADLTLLNEKFEVEQTYVSGALVFGRSS
jgi:N-acetylglucosamine-6-phosphate deacetylase